MDWGARTFITIHILAYYLAFVNGNRVYVPYIMHWQFVTPGLLPDPNGTKMREIWETFAVCRERVAPFQRVFRNCFGATG